MSRTRWPTKQQRLKDDRAREEAQERFEAILHHMSSEGLRQFDALHVLDAWSAKWAEPIVAYVLQELEHATRLVETSTKPRHRPRLPTTNQTMVEFYTTLPRSTPDMRREAIDVVSKALGYEVPGLESPPKPERPSSATKLRKKLKRRAKPVLEPSSADLDFKRRKGRKKLQSVSATRAAPPQPQSEPHHRPEPNWQTIYDGTGCLIGPGTADDKWR